MGDYDDNNFGRADDVFASFFKFRDPDEVFKEFFKNDNMFGFGFGFPSQNGFGFGANGNGGGFGAAGFPFNFGNLTPYVESYPNCHSSFTTFSSDNFNFDDTRTATRSNVKRTTTSTKYVNGKRIETRK